MTPFEAKIPGWMQWESSNPTFVYVYAAIL